MVTLTDKHFPEEMNEFQFVTTNKYWHRIGRNALKFLLKIRIFLLGRPFQCQVVSERQKLMADQIKIRRRQRKDTLLNITRENITATLNAAAAVAASGPLPYFHNFNALLCKFLRISFSKIEN